MSRVKIVCYLDGCNRAASARCFCCDKNVCTRHFTEHIDAVKAQVDPLANEINLLVEKIQGLTVQYFREKPLTVLKQWQNDMQKKFNEIFLTKSKEIDGMIEQNTEKFVDHQKQWLENLMTIQDDVKQLVEDGDATSEQIQAFKSQLANVEKNLVSFQENFPSVDADLLLAQNCLVRVPSSFLNLISNQNQLAVEPPLQKSADPTSGGSGSAASLQIHPTLSTSRQSSPSGSQHNFSVASTSSSMLTPSMFGLGGTQPRTLPSSGSQPSAMVKSVPNNASVIGSNQTKRIF